MTLLQMSERPRVVQQVTKCSPGQSRMRLKLDENLGRRSAELLRKAGHDVATVSDEGLLGAPDRKLMAAAASENRCLVTLDLEFANPLVFAPEEQAGIAVLRLPRQPSFTDLFDACRTLSIALLSADIKGKLWVVQKGRIREYQSERTPSEDA